MRCFLRILLIFTFFLAFFVKPAAANEPPQAVIVNPIRGNDFWNYQHKVSDTPKKQYEVISKNSLPATWLLRYDALSSPEIVPLIKSFNRDQETGLLFEITPTIAEDAGVTFRESGNWHNASTVFLIGYTPSDRKKLIDTAFVKFKETFGFYPKSVGAWWIGADSLLYMKEKYGIEANLQVADQYSTDQYQVWGQYFSTPFYPSKINALLPAQSVEQKIGVVTIQWATRDPYNSFGQGDFDSTFSVQANDYYLHKLDIGYFEKILSFYPQTTVGLENDFGWREFGDEYQRQIQVLSKNVALGQLGIKSMKNFAAYYRGINPGLSPKVVISADDPLGSGKVVWYQTPRYRMGWFYSKKGGSAILDLRLFDAGSSETCLNAPCDNLNLVGGGLSTLDFTVSQTKWVLDEGEITNLKVEKGASDLTLQYNNQSGRERVVKFLDNDISVDGNIQTISGAILAARQLNKAGVGGTTGSSDNLAPNFSLLQMGGNAGKFIVGTVLFFFLPGWVLTRRCLLAIPVGWSLFTLISFIIGIFHLDVLFWVLPVASGILMAKVGLPKFRSPSFNLQWISEVFVVAFGSLTWLLTVVKSGLMYNFGLGFWGPNGHDGVWHLALISELQRNFPPENPVFGGEALTNYHYLFDLLLAKFGNLLAIDSLELLFRLFPAVVAVLAGYLMIEVVGKIFGDRRAGIAAAFFLYFGGSFGWIVSFLREKSFGGETMFWMQQSVSTLLNPPFAISVVLLLTGLYLVLELLKSQQKRLIFPLVLVWGPLVGFKVYAGLLVLAGLGIIAAFRLLSRRDFLPTFAFLGCAVLSLLVFLPTNAGSSTLLIFSPFWIVNSMIDFVDRLGWQRLSLARQAYLSSGNILKLIGVEGLALMIFVLGNLGSRIIGVSALKQMVKHLKQGNEGLLFLLTIFALGMLIPLFFIQKGNGWNIIQFAYYSLLAADVFAGAAVVYLVSKMRFKIGWVIALLLMALTIPTTIGAMAHYLPARPPARLLVEEIEALDFLKKQPDGLVLTLPADPRLKRYSEPVPLFAYTSTAYVAAFSGHQTFLEDTINLEILNVDVKGRINDINDLVTFKDRAKDILQKNNIGYLYVVKAYGFEEDEGRMGIKKIFENDEVEIFKVI